MITRYALIIIVALASFSASAGLVRGFVNKKGKYTRAHFRKMSTKIRKVK